MNDLRLPISMILITGILVIIGLALLFSVNEVIDLNLVVEKLQTNQTFVDNMKCDDIEIGINGIDSMFLKPQEQRDEVKYELQRAYDYKGCKP